MDATLLQELKTQLLGEQKRLKEELGRFAKPTDNPENFETRYNEIGPDREENASEVEEYSDNIALETNLEGQLRDVDDALERMEKGTYGVCENCNEPIDAERLKAYPSAKTCLNCSK